MSPPFLLWMGPNDLGYAFRVLDQRAGLWCRLGRDVNGARRSADARDIVIAGRRSARREHGWMGNTSAYC